jgi:hypothetical protein
MERLDGELKELFARREPSRDFTDRVMARVREHRRPARRKFVWRWIAAGALAASMGIGGFYWREARERQERTRIEQARDELILAVQITNAKLDKAREAAIGIMRRN